MFKIPGEPLVNPSAHPGLITKGETGFLNAFIPHNYQDSNNLRNILLENYIFEVARSLEIGIFRPSGVSCPESLNPGQQPAGHIGYKVIARLLKQ